MESTGRDTLRELIQKRLKDENMVYVVEHTYCQDIQGFVHESVKNGVGEHLKDQTHLNGAYHKIGMKHFWENVLEFAGLRNLRPLDTLKHMRQNVNELSDYVLRHKDLVA